MKNTAWTNVESGQIVSFRYKSEDGRSVNRTVLLKFHRPVEKSRGASRASVAASSDAAVSLLGDARSVAQPAARRRRARNVARTAELHALEVQQALSRDVAGAIVKHNSLFTAEGGVDEKGTSGLFMKLIPAGLLEAGGGQVASGESFCGDQIWLNLIRLRLASPFVVTGRGWTGIRPTGTGF